MKNLSNCVVLIFLMLSSVKPQTLPGDDKSVVAALDTAYQAAVKNNDVATMDRILADD